MEYAGVKMFLCRQMAHTGHKRLPERPIIGPFGKRSYWIPGSYAPALSEKRNSFLRLLKNKGFKKESMTKVGLYAISKSTTLESNKSFLAKHTIAELQNNEEVRRQYLAL